MDVSKGERNGDSDVWGVASFEENTFLQGKDTLLDI